MNKAVEPMSSQPVLDPEPFHETPRLGFATALKTSALLLGCLSAVACAPEPATEAPESSSPPAEMVESTEAEPSTSLSTDPNVETVQVTAENLVGLWRDADEGKAVIFFGEGGDFTVSGGHDGEWRIPESGRLILRFEASRTVTRRTEAVLQGGRLILKEPNVPTSRFRRWIDPDTERTLDHRARQRHTVRIIRQAGTLLFKHLKALTSEEVRPPAQLMVPREIGWSTRKGIGYERMPYQPLGSWIEANFADELPRTDGWGQNLDYAFNRAFRGQQVLAIRSPGSNGVFETNVYGEGTFPREDIGRDIVWMDGYFFQWPK